MQRAFDQVVHDVCVQNLDVTFALDRAGLVARQSDLEGACQELVDAANARGGQDNTTVIMLRYECERDAAKRE